MSSLQTLHLAHLPPSLAIHIALYRDLKNAAYLRQQLLDGNTDFEYALIDANMNFGGPDEEMHASLCPNSLPDSPARLADSFTLLLCFNAKILSTTHVLAAVFRAANDYQNGRIRSRNVHSEIVFALSPNNNIAESFRKFGIADTTKNLLAIKLSTSPSITHESVQEHLEATFKGESIELCDKNFANATDITRLRKAYKLASPAQPASKKKKGEFGETRNEDSFRSELEMSLLGLIALKGAA